VAKVAEIAQSRTRREAAQRLVDVLTTHAGAVQALVYLRAGIDSRQLMRSAGRAAPPDAPSFCEEMELLNYARRCGLEVVRLAFHQEQCGMVLLDGPGRSGAEEPLPLANLVASQAATAFALIAEREQSQRGAMKDPESSAYTFAYFVDVAGREIDKARRHNRRFALVTLSLEDSLSADSAGGAHSTVQRAERVLSVLRDTDILARVDAHEFYVLLPETGGIGAQTCRRRIVRQLGGFGSLVAGGTETTQAAVGVATYPHDGTDLSQLLRVAKRRADVSSRSVVRRVFDRPGSLPELLEVLLAELADSSSQPPPSAGALRAFELSTMQMMSAASVVLAEARRGGAVRVVLCQRPGVSIGAAVRATLGHDAPQVQLEPVDATVVPGGAELEALAIVAEHGTYAFLGRVAGHTVKAVHTADPLLADLVAHRLGEAAGRRLLGV
jgi:diguanylate cyclase (GGDEF)-like protein